MAYFGDATAHAAILGVALSLAFSVSIFLGVLVMALAMASVTSMLSGRLYAMDTLLGVAAHSALAFGLVAVSFLSGVRVDLMAYLVGDILAVGFGDLAMIWIGAAAALVLLCWRWRSLLTVTLNADLAAARGINARWEQQALIVALALVVAVAIKVVGALLITAMLIIPAAAVRPFARTPEMMAILAAGAGVFAALTGLGVSFRLDTTTGPTIVAWAAIFCVVVNLIFMGRRGS